MPTATKAVLEAHARSNSDLSQSQFNKRWLKAKDNDPELTLDNFERGVQRIRKAKRPTTNLVIEGVEFPLSSVDKLLGEHIGQFSAGRNALRDFLETSDKREFKDIAELRSLLKNRKSGPKPGRETAAVVVGETRFPTASAALNAFVGTAKIARRSLLQRIADSRKNQGLPPKAELLFTEREFLDLISNKSALPRAEFESRISLYCAKHEVTLIDSSEAPIDASRAYDLIYRNNLSLFFFSCQPCARVGADHIFSKCTNKLDQGCPECAKEQGRLRRVLPESELCNRVNAHPLGIRLVGIRGEYENNQSIIIVEVDACGHKFDCIADDVREGGRLSHCRVCSRFIGETISVSVVGWLLGLDVESVIAARQRTPPWLNKEVVGSGADLRCDAFFEHVLPNSRSLLLEHQGFQHIADGAHYYKSAINYDAVKRKGALERRGELDFVAIEDVVLNCRRGDVVAAAEWIRKSLVAQCPTIELLPNYRERVLMLSDKGFMIRLLQQVGLRGNYEARLKKQLELEGKTHIEINGFDPVSRRYLLRCTSPEHDGIEHSWEPKSSNALSSEDGRRKGTRCPECAKSLREANARRLSEDELRTRGAKVHRKPSFSYSEYSSGREKKTWECISCAKIQIRHLAKLSPCADCFPDSAGLTPTSPERDVRPG